MRAGRRPPSAAPTSAPCPAWLSRGSVAAASPVGAPRPFADDLDRIPFPARDLLPNEQYQRFGRRAYGHSITTVMSTRGCPFSCEFCSNVVFGGSYRERSPGNVLDEVEEALALGYERISFGDDVFTLRPPRVLAICDEIKRRGLRFSWECLGRVDTFDLALARQMKSAGCFRIFFGIESGNDRVLRLMHKQITTAQARAAVAAAHQAGARGWGLLHPLLPGRDRRHGARHAALRRLTAARLPGPYDAVPPARDPAAGARGQRHTRAWRPRRRLLLDHELTYDADVSEVKMRFGLLKGHLHFAASAGGSGAPLRSPSACLTGRPTGCCGAFGRRRVGCRRCLAANAAMVSATLRRSQGASISDG